MESARTTGPGIRAALIVLGPMVAASAAWTVHYFLPDRQLLPLTSPDDLPNWEHPFPLALMFLFAVAAVAAVTQWFWHPLRPWVQHYAPLTTGAIFLLAIWDLLTVKTNVLKLPNYPGPDTILVGMVDDRVILLESAWHSMLLLATGYLCGVVAGLITGVLIGWFPRVRYWAMPVLKLVGPIPATALVALVMTLSTQSFVCGATLIAFSVWFPVTMLTSSGIANVPRSFFDVARTLGAGRLYLIFRVAIPAAMPTIFIGLFMGLGASFLTLTVAEAVGVKAGLGWYLGWRQGNMEVSKTYAVLMIMALFFSGIMTLLFKLRDLVLGWQKGTIRW